MSNSYAICFDFPENNEPVFAALVSDGLGVTPSLARAVTFRHEPDAQSMLENGYDPELRPYGVVVEVER